MTRKVTSALGALLATLLLTSLALAATDDAGREPGQLRYADYLDALEAFRADDPFAGLSSEATVDEVVAAIGVLITRARAEGQRLDAVVPEACYAAAHAELAAYWHASIDLYEEALPELTARASLEELVPIIGDMDAVLRERHPLAYAGEPDEGGGFGGSPFNILDALGTCEAAATQEADAEDPASSPSPLAEAVRFTPPGTDALLLTDWAAMKAAHGYEGIGSATPLDERMDAFLDLTSQEAPMAGFAIDRFRGHAESWGWDTSDLDWEASYAGEGPPVAVLRFRDGFDLGAVMRRYDERGFTAETYGDAIIRSHPMDPSADWIMDSDLGVLNTAFLDDERTLVLSAGIDGLEAALDARQIEFVRAPSSWLLAEVLGEPLSAGLEIGLDACQGYGLMLAPDGTDPNEALSTGVGPLAAWEAMGLGIYRADERARGRFAFAYGSAEDAAADLGGRLRLAEEANSAVSDAPYAESVLSVLGAAADGPLITLDVAPAEGIARRLSDAWIRRDLPFATCG